MDAKEYNRAVVDSDDPASHPATQALNHIQSCDPSLNETASVILEPTASIDGNQTFEVRMVYRGLSMSAVNY